MRRTISQQRRALRCGWARCRLDCPLESVWWTWCQTGWRPLLTAAGRRRQKGEESGRKDERQTERRGQWTSREHDGFMSYQLWLVRRLHSLVEQIVPADVPEERMFLRGKRRAAGGRVLHVLQFHILLPPFHLALTSVFYLTPGARSIRAFIWTLEHFLFAVQLIGPAGNTAIRTKWWH